MYSAKIPVLRDERPVSTHLEDMTRGTEVTAYWDGATLPGIGAAVVVFSSADLRSLIYFAEDNFGIDPTDFIKEA